LFEYYIVSFVTDIPLQPQCNLAFLAFKSHVNYKGCVLYITQPAVFSLSFEMCDKGNIWLGRVSEVIQLSVMKTLLRVI